SGAGEEAAEIAAVLTERGLGGDSVDLDSRLDQFRRDRSPRASSARNLAHRWVSQVAATEAALSSSSAGKGLEGGSTTAPSRGGAPNSSPEGPLSTGVMLAFAFPDRIARNR